MKRTTGSILVLFILFYSYAHAENNTSTFAYGADVSWVTQMEASGMKFYDKNGVEMECMTLLKTLGFNSIRLRVWVDPVSGWCNAYDVLNKALRAKNLGLRIMINFHYSDSWADPGKQIKPAAWAGLSLADLKTAMANHTTSVLNLLNTNAITPEWIQIGNETGNGLLWEDGKASTNMANYAALSNVGYNAAKAVFPNAKIVVHVQNGQNSSLFQWLFDGLKNNGGKWDVIGMSLYPGITDWATYTTNCLSNMNNLISRYASYNPGFEIMIVETGMSWDSPAASNAFLTDLIAKTKTVTGGRGTGVFYWEPQSYKQWQGYTLGAFDNSGKPTAALNAFGIETQTNSPTTSPIQYIWDKNEGVLEFNEILTQIYLFGIDGQLLNTSKNCDFISTKKLHSGIYIIQAKSASSNKYQSFKLIIN